MDINVPTNLPAYVVPDGMARSVFENKYSRRKSDGTMQSYEERVREMVDGNFRLDPRHYYYSDIDYSCLKYEYQRTMELAVAGIMPTSGRHLQHGDADQLDRGIELHSNCSTTFLSFMSVRLLLRGSGVGRDYTSKCCRVDWDNMPNLRLVLDESHADFYKAAGVTWMESRREARHKYDSESENVRWFTVGDSREGWSKVVEILETAAFQGKHKDKLFIFDFSDVRPEGSPIGGLQGRPASGPLPFMNAIAQIYSIKGSGMQPWKQAMFVDHYLAACVVWGGARRSARMATKSWRDRDVMEFIDIKRGGFLWSANNSVLVDKEFWELARKPQHSHARRVFEAMVNAAYHDASGEPGFINVDMLNINKTGMENITGDTCIDPNVYVDLHPKTKEMIDNVLMHIKDIPYPFITNPCFAADTLIVTDKGALPIKDLVGHEVNIWNGSGWQTVNNFRVTGTNQPMLKITLRDGSSMRVTKNHTMILENGDRVKASELISGSRLSMHDVTYNGDLHMSGAYAKGFLTGDGHIECNNPHLLLYPPKYSCADRLIASVNEISVGQLNTCVIRDVFFNDRNNSRQNRKNLTGLSARKEELLPWCGMYKLQLPNSMFQLSYEAKTAFLAGYFDADGCALITDKRTRVTATSIHHQFLLDIQTLLKSLGIRSRVSMVKLARMKDMPGGTYLTKTCWELVISQKYVPEFMKHIKCSRLPNVSGLTYVNRGPSKHGTVASVEPDGVDDTVYCCTVETHHKVATAVGITTGQCGEVVLSNYGGLCIIGDICLSRVNTMNDALDAADMMARFLVRVNRMKSEYAEEVRRTNRIGVSLTGIHEFAWNLFGLTFQDMVSYYDVLDTLLAPAHKAHAFWQSVDRLRQMAETGAADISDAFGMNHPHTVTTIKPSGTVSKVMNCTEGAHLPALTYYLRWVQFKIGDPDIAALTARGYPMKDISHRYQGHVAIGFPTKQPIVDLMGDKVVTAEETTPEENFKWLRLLEHFWLGEDNHNNQVSYTLKYDANKVSYQQFSDMILEWQPQVRCCSVMPQSDWRESERIYGYVPEQPITKEEYETYMAAINPVAKEAYDDEQLMCEGGVCPIEMDINR